MMELPDVHAEGLFHPNYKKYTVYFHCPLEVSSHADSPQENYTTESVASRWSTEPGTQLFEAMLGHSLILDDHINEIYIYYMLGFM